MRKVILSSFLTVSIFLSALLLIFGAVPYAKATLTSTNVVFVPSASNPEGGTLPTTDPAFAAFNFSTMAWANVNAANLAPYDTVVLMISTSTVPLTASQQADLINWVDGGGKLIIYDSETVPSVDYSWLPYPMTTTNPGAMGYTGGNITFVEYNTLGCTDPGNVTYYINITMVPTGGWSDGVGDCNTFITFDPHWYGDIKAQNYYSYPPSHGYNGSPAGWAHTYAPYSDGLFIYNGFDIDPLWSDSVPDSTVWYSGNLAKIWLMELKQPWGADFNLPCGAPAIVYYNVTLKAYCFTEGAYVSVSITMDGTATGFNTPYTFTDLNGTHTFTVPSNDPNGHPFKKWDTNQTSTTITVSGEGTYTTYYGPAPPSPLHDIAVTNVMPSKTVVGQGYPLSINVTVENQGDYAETFNVTAYYSNATTTFTPEQWDTFWSMGDVNRDGHINHTDADIIMDNYGWTGPPGENPADINSDGLVDMGDMIICVENQGLNIWTYFSTFVVIGVQEIVNLLPGNSAAITFVWDTTDVAKAKHTIKAVADPVPSETDTDDNTYLDGWVKVTIPGDVTEDELIWADMQDIDILIAGFMSTPRADGKYWHDLPCDYCPHSPNCDVNNDNSIDMADISIAIDHFMQS